MLGVGHAAAVDEAVQKQNDMEGGSTDLEPQIAALEESQAAAGDEKVEDEKEIEGGSAGLEQQMAVLEVGQAAAGDGPAEENKEDDVGGGSVDLEQQMAVPEEGRAAAGNAPADKKEKEKESEGDSAGLEQRVAMLEKRWAAAAVDAAANKEKDIGGDFAGFERAGPPRPAILSVFRDSPKCDLSGDSWSAGRVATTAEATSENAACILAALGEEPRRQGLTLVHLRAQLEQLQDTFMS